MTIKLKQHYFWKNVFIVIDTNGLTFNILYVHPYYQFLSADVLAYKSKQFL